MQLIPTSQSPQYRQEIELESENYFLLFSWNALNEYWSLSLYDKDSNPIALGIKIVTQFNLTKQIVQDGMPLGNIVCQNILGKFTKIERDSIGTDTELVFYPSEELNV